MRKKTDDFTEDLYVIQDDRVHRGVFWLETEVTVLFVERFTVAESSTSATTLSPFSASGCFGNDDFITAVDPGFDHTVSFTFNINTSLFGSISAEIGR